ncbi:hypothetical protein EON68_04580 [archaeon]|nr:MAG: hypothetical protein EON68_04580 [archaeon]
MLRVAGDTRSTATDLPSTDTVTQRTFAAGVTVSVDGKSVAVERVSPATLSKAADTLAAAHKADPMMVACSRAVCGPPALAPLSGGTLARAPARGRVLLATAHTARPPLTPIHARYYVLMCRT